MRGKGHGEFGKCAASGIECGPATAAPLKNQIQESRKRKDMSRSTGTTKECFIRLHPNFD
ncbi:MAG: hypothetical protein PHS86_03370 [Syntrophaceae bacterium]|nr:hypothetical protein [Syntrophaceae bacterium]